MLVTKSPKRMVLNCSDSEGSPSRVLVDPSDESPMLIRPTQPGDTGSTSPVYQDAGAAIASFDFIGSSKPRGWPWWKRMFYLTQEPFIRALLFTIITGLVSIALLSYGIPTLIARERNFGASALSMFVSILVGCLIAYFALWVVVIRWIANGAYIPAELLQSVDLRGKTAIITGANSGIGFVCALQLARMGARVILACRDSERMAEAVDKIRNTIDRENVHTGGSAEGMLLDLMDLESVGHFATEIKRRCIPVHILLNNAGVMFAPYGRSKQNHEVQFATNHLGHFALTNALLENILDNKGRIVVVSSFAHTFILNKMFSISEVAEVTPETYNAFRFYGIAKLSNILFTKELQRRLSEISSDTIAVTLHPGTVRTELVRYMPLLTLLRPFVLLLFKSPYAGAQTSLFACIAPNESLVPGAFYQDCKVCNTFPEAEDADFGRELWNYSDRVTRKLMGTVMIEQ